jgi:hypothetical protein
MVEVYRNIKGYPNYQVSVLGSVRNKKTGLVLKPGNNQGYKLVCLSNQDGPKTVRVHRLVALAFIKNPLRKPKVDHIDGNRSNNRVCNLRWATNEENGINCIKRKSKTGFKGVGYDDVFKKWYVDLPYRSWGTRIYKTFDSVEEAIVYRFTMINNKYGFYYHKQDLFDYKNALDSIFSST